MGLQNLQSLSGIVLTVLICWLLSENRRKFPFRLLAGAVLIQVAIVLLLFGLPRPAPCSTGQPRGRRAVGLDGGRHRLRVRLPGRRRPALACWRPRARPSCSPSASCR